MERNQMDELELNAIEDAFLMPAITEKDIFERQNHINNAKFFLEHRIEFENNQWIEV